MIVVISEIKPMPNDVKNFIEAIHFLTGLAIQSDGCIASKVYCTEKACTTIVMIEEWQSMKKYKAYIKSMKYKQVISLFELAAAKPTVKISEIITTNGLSWIENEILGNISEVSVQNSAK